MAAADYHKCERISLQDGKKYSLTKESISSSFSILHIGNVAGVPQNYSEHNVEWDLKVMSSLFKDTPLIIAQIFRLTHPSRSITL